MITSKSKQENESPSTVLSCEHEASPLVNRKPENEKSNNIMDREIGSLRSNFYRTKMFFKNTSILDRDMGTLRSHLLRMKIFFKNILSYIRSFFTKKKVNEVKAVFSYKRTLEEMARNNKSISSGPTNANNGLKH